MNEKTFIIENFGCQMNLADTSEVKKALSNDGYIEAEDSPDIVILNSCAIRETSEERIYGRLRHYSVLKKKKPFTLVLMGCVAQKEKDNILKVNPSVDMVIGTHQKSRIPEILSDYLLKDERNQSETFMEQSAIQVFDRLGDYEFSTSVPSTRYPFKADITIIHGCNKYCSYCIVPYTRGTEMSQKSGKIIDNVKDLVSQGLTEIQLLGQNVNSYGQDNNDIPFSELLYKLNEINGLKRIRFLTSHPKDFNSELIDVIQECDKVCKYIHLPLQSASDFVLNKMKREYTYEHYRSIISELKEKIPHCVLSTDILVGFPYESVEDFEKTLEAMKEIRYDTAYMFKYSVRTGTASANYPDLVDEAEKKRRLQLIIDTQHKIVKEQNEKDLGKTEEVLLERVSRKSTNQLLGKTDGNKPVVIEADKSMIGSYQTVQLEGLKGNTFHGTLI